ncbi:hypothetical protein N3K66_005127 [Trichothecium roseum]|uniref:Uncharacterized protein n=1 Tax=Trichothecium roseum TaxID=47278 RepID=A0ACC0V397_9HYPO|nr:hypothetical protein N3K66_005127 [Trichothecium roseum]
MQFSAIFSLAAIFSVAAADSVSYDTGYDLGQRSLSVIACSDGQNGLMTRYGWETQADIPTFPFIGGVAGIAHNSPDCGKCYRIQYQENSIAVLAIDSSSSGFNLGLNAMDALTNGQGEELGRVEATVTAVDVSECGI